MKRDKHMNLRPCTARERFSEKRIRPWGMGRSAGFMREGIKKPSVVGEVRPERKAGRKRFVGLKVSCGGFHAALRLTSTDHSTSGRNASHLTPVNRSIVGQYSAGTLPR